MKQRYQQDSGVIVVYPLPRTSIEELDGMDSELQVMVSRLHVAYGRIPHHDTERCHNSWFPDAVSGFHVYSLRRLSADRVQQVKEFFQFGIRSARRRHGESIAVAAWIPKHQSMGADAVGTMGPNQTGACGHISGVGFVYAHMEPFLSTSTEAEQLYNCCDGRCCRTMAVESRSRRSVASQR